MPSQITFAMSGYILAIRANTRKILEEDASEHSNCSENDSPPDSQLAIL